MGTLYQLVAHQAFIPPVELARFRWTGLLRNPTEAASPDIVCNCCRVGKHELFDGATRAPRTWESIQNATGAGLICGSCEPPIRAILADAARHASAALDPEMCAARAKTFELSIIANRKLDHIPGNNGLPILGHYPVILFDPFKFLKEIAARYGPVFRFNAVRERWVVVGAPDGAREVLADSKRNFSNRLGWTDRVGKLLAGALLLDDFDVHQQNRGVAEKLFRQEAMDLYLPMANLHFKAGIESWPVGEVFAFLPAMRKLSLELAAAMLLGGPLGAEFERVNRSMDGLADSVAALVKREVPGSAYRRGMRGRRHLVEYITALITERRNTSRDDMLAQLCQATGADGGRLSEQEIVDQMIFAMLGAHEFDLIEPLHDNLAAHAVSRMARSAPTRKPGARRHAARLRRVGPIGSDGWFYQRVVPAFRRSLRSCDGQSRHVRFSAGRFRRIPRSPLSRSSCITTATIGPSPNASTRSVSRRPRRGFAPHALFYPVRRRRAPMPGHVPRDHGDQIVPRATATALPHPARAEAARQDETHSDHQTQGGITDHSGTLLNPALVAVCALGKVRMRDSLPPHPGPHPWERSGPFATIDIFRVRFRLMLAG